MILASKTEGWDLTGIVATCRCAATQVRSKIQPLHYLATVNAWTILRLAGALAAGLHQCSKKLCVHQVCVVSHKPGGKYAETLDKDLQAGIRVDSCFQRGFLETGVRPPYLLYNFRWLQQSVSQYQHCSRVLSQVKIWQHSVSDQDLQAMPESVTYEYCRHSALHLERPQGQDSQCSGDDLCLEATYQLTRMTGWAPWTNTLRSRY